MLDIIVKNLSYRYKNNKKVLSNINIELERGRSLGIIGTNGSGKTTFCYCLCGIIPHFFNGKMEGNVLINGKDTRDVPLRRMSKKIGIILQNPNDQLMMPTVEDEIAFGLENNLIERAEIKRKIDTVINELEINDIRHSRTENLSGGQKQIAAIAASLVLEPNILIFDEVLSMLDEWASARIIKIIKQLKNKEKTLVIIDHTNQTLGLLDEVLVLENGKTLQQGNKELLETDSLYKEKNPNNIY